MANKDYNWAWKPDKETRKALRREENKRRQQQRELNKPIPGDASKKPLVK